MGRFPDHAFDDQADTLTRSLRRLQITTKDSDWRDNVVKSLAFLPEVFDIKLVGAANGGGGRDRVALWIFDWGTLSAMDWRGFWARRDDTYDVNLLIAGGEPATFWAEQALRAGAQGFISRDAEPRELALAIVEVLEGRIFLSEGIAIPVTRRIFSRHDSPNRGLIGLSQEEIALVKALAGGCPSTGLADALACSKSSSEVLLRNVLRALGLSGVRELRKVASQLDFIG